MEFTVLGSGGNTPTPMPTCDCRVCEQARAEGVPYARRGNALFYHDDNILIDAPELVWETLNRAGVDRVDGIFLSHFHADHVLGLRTLQPLGVAEPPVSEFVADTTTLYVNEVTHERTVEGNEALGHLAEQWADVRVLTDGETLALGDCTVTHHTAPIEEGGPRAVSGFLFEDEGATAFVSPDENRHFELGKLPDLDLWVKETGYFAETPDGEPLFTEAAEEGVLAHELSFAESLDQVRQVGPDKTVLTEIEELYRRSHDDYRALARRHRELNVHFAHDGMELTV